MSGILARRAERRDRPTNASFERKLPARGRTQRLPGPPSGRSLRTAGAGRDCCSLDESESATEATAMTALDDEQARGARLLLLDESSALQRPG